MLTKCNQPSEIKIEIARVKNTSECYQELHEDCGENVLSFRTVALWIKAFRVRRNETHWIFSAHVGRPFLNIKLIS